MLAASVGVLALPSAVLAFSAASFSSLSAPPNRLDSLDPEGSPENLARVIAMRSLAKGQPFPFTPAGTPNRTDRSVTVAVRVDPEAAKAIIVHNSSQIAQSTGEPGRLRFSPAAFNLGVSRGYQNFAQDLVPQAPSRPLAEMPDIRKFSLQPGAPDNANSRFSTRLSLDEKRAAGRAPRTFAGDPAGEVDLSGAYRVTENLDVTAGVRYSQERERLSPLTDGRQDSQAVYVGTQFRF
ncbi:hypothetical protein [Novosphingobium sp.]|uniref:hypothetical protein n=1 Tax=Novosphingobium sp. TaxID=1874826 RepID=UPI002B47B30E|nr:hypothetical protein [Novosphingobium sp.]HKR92044.1 hypothetical protein [Novosphingobium sp.]